MRSILKSFVAASASLAVSCMVSIPTAAQTGAAGPKPDGTKAAAQTSKQPCIGCSADGKTTPRMPDGHPDLNGFWDNPFPGVVFKRPDGSYGYLQRGNPKDPVAPAGLAPEKSEPSYKSEYAAKVKEIIANSIGPTSLVDPLQLCKPLGVPRSMIPPLHIVQTKDLVIVLYESDAIGGTFRLIYMDGRQHPSDIDPSYLGDSIGHWEGDTLVVDVIGLNDDTWLGGGEQSEKFALMHSSQEHVTERYSRSGDMLTYEATVEDPVMLTKPWVISPRHIKHGGPDDRLYETFCDNRDISHYVTPAPVEH